jgi:hypothetical protein
VAIAYRAIQNGFEALFTAAAREDLVAVVGDGLPQFLVRKLRPAPLVGAVFESPS